MTFGEAPSRARRVVQNEDVLVSSVRPYLRGFAQVKQLNYNTVCSTGFTVLRAKSNVDSGYLYQFILSDIFMNQIVPKMTGSNYPAVNASDIGNVELQLPMLTEQRKIAAILTSVDDAIDATQRIIDQIEAVKRGLMQQLLTKGIGHTKFKETEIGEIPTEWNIATIGETCIVGTGGTPRRDEPQNWNGTIPWVKTTEVKNGIINETEEFITEYALKSSSVKVYPAGTVLLAMYGQGVTRGKCAILGIDATTNQACAAMQPNENLSNKFLFYVLQHNYENLRGLGHGSNQANLNLNLVKSFPIPVASIEEQERIASMIETLDMKLEREQASKSVLEQLKSSLMQVLLTGKVRVNVDEMSEVSV